MAAAVVRGATDFGRRGSTPLPGKTSYLSA